MGFRGADLNMRLRLWLCYATHGKAMFGKASRRKQNEILKRCHQVLVCKVEALGRVGNFRC